MLKRFQNIMINCMPRLGQSKIRRPHKPDITAKNSLMKLTGTTTPTADDQSTCFAPALPQLCATALFKTCHLTRRFYGTTGILLSFCVSAPVATSQDVAALHRLCASTAVKASPGRVLGVRFDIVTANDPATQTQDPGLGTSLMQSPNAPVGYNTASQPYISYDKCHVRLLSKGRMKTKHYQILDNSLLVEYQPPYDHTGRMTRKASAKPANKSLGQPLSSQINNPSFLSYFSETSNTASQYSQSPSKTRKQTRFVEPYEDLFSIETGVQSIATSSTTVANLPWDLGEPLNQFVTGKPAENRLSELPAGIDFTQMISNQATPNPTNRAINTNSNNISGLFTDQTEQPDTASNGIEGVQLQTFYFTE